MLLLKFVKLGDGGAERSVGALNWYPIHPTDRGQKNTLVTGDSKGYASSLFEQQMEADHSAPEPFVAAFANANCGDVSGNVELGHIPDGIHDQAQMEKHGRQQPEVAQQLFANASEEVSGPVEHRHTRVDFSDFELEAAVRTWPGSLGASFAAGSSEDSVPVPKLGFHEGMTEVYLDEGDNLLSGLAGLGLSAIFGISVIDEAAARTERDGQLPKPVILMPGIESPPVVPQVLPVQILRIGTIAVLGIPRRADHDGRPPAPRHGARRAVLRGRPARCARDVRQRLLPVRDHARGVRLPAVRRSLNPVRATHARGISAGGRRSGRLNRRRRSREPRSCTDPMDLPAPAPLPIPQPLKRPGEARVLPHRLPHPALDTAPMGPRRFLPAASSPSVSENSPGCCSRRWRRSRS